MVRADEAPRNYFRENLRNLPRKLLFGSAVVGATLSLAACGDSDPTTASPESETPSASASPFPTDSESPSPAPSESSKASSSEEPLPSGSETETGFEIPSNAVMFEDLAEKWETISEAEIVAMGRNRDMQGLAELQAFVMLQALEKGVYPNLNSVDTDCSMPDEAPDNPINTLAFEMDAQDLFCSIAGLDTVAAQQTQAKYTSSADYAPEKLDVNKAEKVFVLQFAIGLANNDPVTQSHLERGLAGIEGAVEHGGDVYTISYGDIPASAEIVGEGKIDIKGVIYHYRDIRSADDELGSVTTRVVFVPLENPIVREVPLKDARAWDWADDGYGEMLMTQNPDGSATPVTTDHEGRIITEMEDQSWYNVSKEVAHQIHIPVSLGTPSDK